MARTSVKQGNATASAPSGTWLGGALMSLRDYFEFSLFVLLSLFLMHQQGMAAPTQSSKRDSRSRPATSGSLSAVTYTRSARQPLVALKRTLFPGSKAANGWDPATDMPSQAGRVAIVTGGNAGIGFETVRGLLRKGARVYIASRPHQRSANAIERLRADIKEQGSGGEVKLLPCDVSDLASVTRAANEFLR